MPKRQREAKPSLWYSAKSGMYLAPYDQRGDFDALRKVHPGIKHHHWNSQSPRETL